MAGAVLHLDFEYYAVPKLYMIETPRVKPPSSGGAPGGTLDTPNSKKAIAPVAPPLLVGGAGGATTSAGLGASVYTDVVNIVGSGLVARGTVIVRFQKDQIAIAMARQRQLMAAKKAAEAAAAEVRRRARCGGRRSGTRARVLVGRVARGARRTKKRRRNA